MHETSDIIAVDAPEEPVEGKTRWNSRAIKICRKSIRTIFYRLHRLLGELTALVLGVGIGILWFGTSLLEQQSTDLTLLRPNIKLWFAEAFEGHDTEFTRLEMAWLPSLDQLVVTIEGAEILDNQGEIIEQYDLIRSTLSFDDGLLETPRLINAEVRGGVLSFIEDEHGEITFGLGPPDSVGRVGPVYGGANQDVSSSPEGHDIQKLLQDIDFLQLYDVELYTRSAPSGIDLKANVNSMRATFSNEGDLTVAADGTCDQTSSDPVPFYVASVIDRDFENIKLRLSLEGARPDEIAPKKGRFWELQGLAAAVDLTAEVDFSRQLGLQSAALEMDVSKGSFTLLRENESRSYPLNSLIARASLAPGQERMDISQLDLNSPNLSFNSSGFLTELGMLSDGDANSSPLFNLSAKNIRANMTPRFSAETQIHDLNIIGYSDFDSRELIIQRGSVALFDSKHEFSGDMSVTDKNQLKSLSFRSKMTGTLSHEELLMLWPVTLFEGARKWIDRSILGGNLTQVETRLNLDEAYFEAPSLTSDRFNLQFVGHDVDVKYMDSMPLAKGVKGEGALSGNRLDVSFDSGNVGAVAVQNGTVEIPVILPFGGDIIVKAKGEGEVSAILEVANNPPFKIASRYNIEPRDLQGEGDISIDITRPLRSNVPADSLIYNIKGDFTGVKAPFQIGEYDIQNGEIALDINRDRVIMSGPVEIGPWATTLSWEESFGDPNALTQYSASGVINADLLDELGLASRTWFDGDAAITVRAEGNGTDLKYAEFDLDLTDSELSFEHVWLKPKGKVAHFLSQLSRTAEGGYSIKNARLSSEGVDVKGGVELDANFKPQQFDIPEIRIESLIDGAVRIMPDREAGRLGVDVNAAYLDVSPWTENLFQERQSNLDIPLSFQANVDTLVLDRDYIVTDSKLDFAHSGKVIEAAGLQAFSDGKLLNLELKTRDDKRREVAVVIPDASKAVSAFIGLDNTSGGSLNIIADLPAEGEDGPIIGDAEMLDFKLNRAPALAQLLSLASLTGLSDTLTNGSMQFDRFKVPFTVLGDDIAIRDARLYGPALGMTGDGEVNLEKRVMDFDGTIVPAYTANSLLADIPLLGEIFAQEKGGGLFALTYTVNGPFEKTQIAVNPLSALTPGFLRQIFKRDRSHVDEAIKEAVLDVAPPELEAQ